MTTPLQSALDKLDAAIGSRDFRTALALALDALPKAQAANDTDTLAMLHFTAGGLYIWTGDQTRAEQHLRNFLDTAPHTEAMHAKRGAAWYNIGLIESQRRRYPAAAKALDYATAFLTIANNARRTAEAQLETAYIQLRMGNLDKASRLLAEARSNIPDDGSKLELLLWAHTAHLDRLRGNVTPAAALSESILAAKKGDAHTRFLACWQLGELALAAGLTDTARDWEARMRDAAIEHGLPALTSVLNDFSQRLNDQSAAD